MLKDVDFLDIETADRSAFWFAHPLKVPPLVGGAASNPPKMLKTKYVYGYNPHIQPEGTNFLVFKRVPIISSLGSTNEKSATTHI